MRLLQSDDNADLREFDSMMRHICPRCLNWITEEILVKQDPETWAIACTCCRFSINHQLLPEIGSDELKLIEASAKEYTKKEISLMMGGVCPCCRAGATEEGKIIGECNAWMIVCQRCGFSVIHHYPPVRDKSIGASRKTL